MKAEGRMQKSPLLHSSFLLPTFPVLAQQTALRDSALLQSGASPQVVSEAKDKPAMARRMAERLANVECRSANVELKSHE